MSEAEAKGAVGEYIAFRIRSEEYCIEIMAVREIRRWSNATSLPRAPEFVKGVINLRGAVLPVIDFGARLGLGASEVSERHSIIIVETNDQMLGLLVDTVSDILAVSDDTLQPTPSIASEKVHEIVSGLIIIEDRMLRLVNVDNISPHVATQAA